MLNTHASEKSAAFTSFHVIFIRAIQMNWIKVIAIDSVPVKTMHYVCALCTLHINSLLIHSLARSIVCSINRPFARSFIHLFIQSAQTVS